MVTLLLGSVAPALAQGRPASPSENHPSFKERVLDIFQRNEERREERRQQLSERRAAQLRQWEERTVKRLTNIVSHLDRIAELIQDRIDTLKDRGRDVTAVQAQMDTAKSMINNAKQSVASASEEFEDILAGGDDEKIIFRDLHALQRDVLDDIRAAHRALIKVLAATRGLSVTPTAHPTASPAASGSPTPTPTPTATP